MREHFVAARGLRVRYLEEGSGPVVLLLHGASLGSSADVWTRNLPDLAARGLRAMALDLPGFGESDIPGDPSVGFRTRFVPDFLEAVGVAHAHIVGHSQSGRIALALALKSAPCVEKIVIVGTGSLLPPLEGMDKADAGEGDEGGLAEPTVEETRRSLAATVFDQALVTDEAVAQRQRMSVGRNFAAFCARREARGTKDAAKVKDSAPPWQRMSEVAGRMRLIYGREDRGHAAQRAELAKRLHPQLDIHVLPRCRHLVQWDAPREFAALVGEFLRAPEKG